MTPDLHQIRAQHGGTVYDGGRRWVGPGPGHSRRDASLSVWITDDGRPVVHSFAKDDFRDCLDHLGFEVGDAKQQDRAEWERMRRERAERQRLAGAETQAFCEGVWNGTSAIEGTPAETYLFRRGLIIEASPVVRFHPAAPRTRNPQKPDGPAPAPAMVAVAQDRDGRARGLHCTYLAPDGRKAFSDRSKLMFGRLSGCAVRLSPVGADGVLAVAEGIESAASFSVARDIPSWATLSTSGLQGFSLPDGVRRLIIAADGDPAGHRAAEELASRLQRACAVSIDAAPDGRDWNDVIQGDHHG